MVVTSLHRSTFNCDNYSNDNDAHDKTNTAITKPIITKSSRPTSLGLQRPMPGSQHQPWVLLPSFSSITITITTITIITIIITIVIPTSTFTFIITTLHIDPHGNHDVPGVLQLPQPSSSPPQQHPHIIHRSSWQS